MNIFIDSNIIFQDYFFENKSNKQLLEYCREGLLSIYMSEIVKLELRRQFEKEIISQNREIKKLIKDSSRLKVDFSWNEILLSDQMIKFDDFYNKLEYIDNFYFLNYKNEFLPDIVDRAIHRKKPFTEEKSELKDALIWKTYSDYVEQYNSIDCILLTNNTSDFCQKNDKNSIHPDLAKDSTRFSVINSSFDFIKRKGPLLESPEYKFQSYFNQIDFTEEYVLELISDNFEQKIRDHIHSEVDRIHPSEILSESFIFDGQLIAYDIELLYCEDIESEVIADKALISGVLFVNCETDILEYNSVRDAGEDSFTTVGEKILQFRVFFNFDFKENEIVDDFEINGSVLDEIS
jgi:predicted nucleic acid-binding protein